MSDFSVNVNDDFVSAGLDDVREWDGTTSFVDPGDYLVEVTGAEHTTASTGKPMLKIEYTIADGPSEGRKLFANYMLTSAKGSRARLKNFLTAANRLTNGGYALSSLKGARLIVGVEGTTYPKENLETGEVETKEGRQVGRERRAS
jgi:uncharacterized protein DUF669